MSIPTVLVRLTGEYGRWKPGSYRSFARIEVRMMRTVRLTVPLAVFLMSLLVHTNAQTPVAPLAHMAPVEQYLSADASVEIALARSAAPKAISDGAEVLVLGRQGYNTAIKGKNGFVCMVARSWTAGIDDPEFWNPKRRGPICFNPPAARSYLPLMVAKTRLVLAGRSKTQMFDAMSAALDKKELPAIEVGAMCYMLSKDGHLSDRDGRWHPHLMFFVPRTDPKTWGADQPESPVFMFDSAQDRVTTFMVPVAKWSDGTSDSPNHSSRKPNTKGR